jgi:hypothetical protein
MNLQDFVDAASAYLNQNYPESKLDSERVNLFLKLTNYDFFKQWCGLPEEWKPGQPVTSRGWQVAQQNSEALKTFLVTISNQTISQGQLVYPTNFVHLTRIGYFNSITSRQRPVVQVSDSEWDDRLGNPITAPELEYPIFRYQNGSIDIRPTSIQNVSITYLRLSVTPIYSIVELNGINDYDSVNSVQFEWPEYLHNDILNIFLGYITLAAKDGSLSERVELKKNKGI